MITGRERTARRGTRRRSGPGWGALALLAGLALAAGCDDAQPVSADEADAIAADAGGGGRPDAFLPPKDQGAPLVDAEDPPPPPADAAMPVDPPNPVVRIETILGTGITRAGLANRVTCQALDADDLPIAGIDLRSDIHPADGWARDPEAPDQLTGRTAGIYLVTCHAPGLGLRDGTPARWDVLAGPAHRLATTVEPDVITAGESAHVTCEAWDEFGNELDSEDAFVQVRPEALGVTIDGRELTVTTADRYVVTCADPAAAEQIGAPLDVLPGRPDRLVASVQPVAPVYDIGQVITYAARVIDEFGNPVPDAPLVWTARPRLPEFGEGRYRPDAEGRYRLRVEVEGTDLVEETEILVDAGGPAIACLNPPDGAMVGMGQLNLEGRVADVAGVESVTVNGRAVAVADDGRFSTAVEPTWGLNVQEIIARDAVGNANSTFCAWFSSAEYIGENARAADVIQLHLAQGAVDDGAPDQPIRSLTDLLRRVLNSQGLLTTVDEALRAQNPIVPNDCRQSLPIVGCVFRLGAVYRGMRIRGARTASLTLVDNGLRLQARLNGLELDVQLTGTVTNRGTITAEYVAVDLTFDVALQNGRPVVRLRGNGNASVGRLDSDFDGIISGTLLDLIFGAFEGTIRNEVVSALRSFLADQTDDILAGLLNGLDLQSLSVGLVLPGLGGGPETPMSLAVDFASLNVNPSRMLLGISTRVDGPTRQAAASAGVPMPPGPRTVALRPAGNAGAAVNLGLLNQLLHRAWRAGVFTLPDAGDLLGGLGDGVRLGIRVLVPPAVRGRVGDTGVELHLGPAVAEVTWPDLFDQPLTLRMAATAEASVRLERGTDVTFGDIRVTRLYLSLEGVNVTPQARLTLERELGRIVSALVGEALSGALPSLPIPDFALPDVLVQYGVPRGTRLGIRDLSLSGQTSHFLLSGNLRE
ncbi:MAG: hypothetical protein H6706_21630 [Myxococcales bacterium]|nr:hypothetical protein [Myxococcales bacterium]